LREREALHSTTLPKKEKGQRRFVDRGIRPSSLPEKGGGNLGGERHDDRPRRKQNPSLVSEEKRKGKGIKSATSERKRRRKNPLRSAEEVFGGMAVALLIKRKGKGERLLELGEEAGPARTDIEGQQNCLLLGKGRGTPCHDQREDGRWITRFSGGSIGTGPSLFAGRKGERCPDEHYLCGPGQQPLDPRELGEKEKRLAPF